MLNINKIRKEYQLKSFHKSELSADPFQQFQIWFQEALDAAVLESNAMCLATANAKCQPSSRMVLLKGVDEKGFCFYTSYESKKSQDLAENPQACATFFWKELERQVIISGDVEKLHLKESESYFASRPRGSQLAAWASHQTHRIPSRKHLELEYEQMKQKFEGLEIPMPDYWGGYRIIPSEFQFWQGRPNRLHDRLRYLQAVEKGVWLIERLAP